MREHVPVMLPQVVEILENNVIREKPDNAKIVDCTLGLGGYSEAFLNRFPGALVFGVDRDGAALEIAKNKLSLYGQRFEALHMNFGNMDEVLAEGVPYDAFVFDLGVSNMQLTEPDRGFSFQEDGPLDMRMNPDGNLKTAADVLDGMSAEELAKIFWIYGEERYSRMIAAKVEEKRRRGIKIGTTGELVELIREALPAPVQRKMGTHPARRVFQALRIFVNDELGELEQGLALSKKMAVSGGVSIVVSYHSLEDRIVKHTFRRWEREEKAGRVLTKHPLPPEAEEIDANFKARSAKLRAFLFGGGDLKRAGKKRLGQ